MAYDQKNEIGINIGCVTDWGKEASVDSILKGLEACMGLGYTLFVIEQKGDDGSCLAFLKRLEKDYPKHCKMLEDNDINQEWVLRNAQVLLIPHSPSKKELAVAQHNKLVPLTVQNPYLRNFNPAKETGEGFLFEAGNTWDFVRAVVRAAENKQFSYDWGNLKKALGQVSL